MKILIAEDETVSRHQLKTLLTQWGYDVVITCDGDEAWHALQQEGAPPLAILEWLMPGMSGVEICRKLRSQTCSLSSSIYLILLTTNGAEENIVEGLDAGADDYIVKPFNQNKLRARVNIGTRLMKLQSALSKCAGELEESLLHLKQLHGFLPICCYCKKIRDDQGIWQQPETYIAQRSYAQFTHSICPRCCEEFVKPELEPLRTLKDKHGNQEVINEEVLEGQRSQKQ